MAKRGYESQKTGQKVDDLLDKIDNLNVPEWALQESKPSYTAQEVHALPENTSIPRNTSDLTNDMGYISHESDPTVPSWAKQPTKPAYTAEEVGALPSDTPVFSGDYNDLSNKPTIPAVPENVSAFNNDAGYLTEHQDISGKEDKSNKVTSLSAQSTDTQYPSAKTVYDELENKQDTINDLSTIRSGASAGATAYQKPQAGIPESDLSQGVKDKMNEKEVFWATYGQTTAAEIDAAVAAGKVVMCYFLQHIYKLEDCRSDQPLYFSCFIASQARYFLTVNRTTSAWANNLVNHELSSYKVSSWSNTPNDTRYPSEKLVKESLDAKADIGDILFANFSRLTPKKIFEYDVSDTAYHPLFSRANTGISKLMSEVDDIVKFRITVTGTNIYARVDVVVRFQPALTYPCIMVWNENFNASNAYTGIANIRSIYPRALNNGYDWLVEFNAHSVNARHIKVEVFEYTESVTWVETKEDSSYNTATQNHNALDILANRGLIANQTWRLISGFAGSSNYANYIASYLTSWLGGTMPFAGENFSGNQLAIISGQKMYKATNKNVPINCDCGVFFISNAITAESATSYVYIRQKFSWGALTGDPALTFDTFTRGDQVYLRCTLGLDGKIYPDGHLSNVKSAGYTWVHIGTAASATAINLDTCGKPFITLNNDGKVTHINGTAVMDSSMSKWGVVSQTQTWSGGVHIGYTYVMSGLVYGWIPISFIDLIHGFGAVFNEYTGYFELNGLTDISYKEMLDIYSQINSVPTANYSTHGWSPMNSADKYKITARTTLNSIYSKAYYFTTFAWNDCIETIQFTKTTDIDKSLYTYKLYGGTIIMYNCTKLKTIYDIIDAYNSSGDNLFKFCHSLETLYFKNVQKNVTFAQSPNLTVESILYMIQNEASTSAITITLHPTAYARAIADSDVQAALQAHTNVSLASAT